MDAREQKVFHALLKGRPLHYQMSHQRSCSDLNGEPLDFLGFNLKLEISALKLNFM